MEQGKTIAIIASEAGERLDKVLTQRLAPLSRSQVKKMIEHGRVLRNGKATTVHAFVSEGDTISILSHEDVVLVLPEIEVLAETDGYVVINKPAGVLVHPADSAFNEATITDWMIKRYPETANVGDAGRPGIVHRLDRDTSGVMVLAKTPEMFTHLKKQFGDRTVKKTYIALVHGRMRQDEGEINLPIGRSHRTGRMAVRPQDTYEEDKPAITNFTVIKRFRKPFCLVKAYPLTGRTHQIRAHFMALSHPIAGETVYTVKNQAMRLNLGRHFLHAESLTFTDLKGEAVTVNAVLPADLQTFLDNLV